MNLIIILIYFFSIVNSKKEEFKLELIVSLFRHGAW
jgi:hypothetical protein